MPVTLRSISPGVLIRSTPMVPSLEVILENITALPRAFVVSNLLASYVVGVSPNDKKLKLPSTPKTA